MSQLDIVLTEDEQFKENYPKIMKKIEKKKLIEMEPTLEEMTKVYDVIINYIKINKRKVYGGYALNKLLIVKNPNLAIYDESDTPDIEFYSPDPLGDLIKLCDKLHELGFKQVIGQEAQHKETYSIFVNYQLYCDISYMPSNIYNKVRYLQIDGFNLIHPWFMTIDFFRMFTDPMVSYWRLEKHFARYLKLQKTNPLPLINKPLDIEQYNNNKLNETITMLEDFLAPKDSIIFTGFYAYNYYLNYSKYNKTNSSYKQVQLPYLEVYSSDYVVDGLSIIDYIKTLPEDISSKITHSEFYPFFQFYGYNTVFYYTEGDTNIPILYIYSNNKKCIPYKEVPYIKFDNVKIKWQNIPEKKINIGSFDFNILHALIILIKVRVDDDNSWIDILYKLINGYVSFRKYYFLQNNKTLYDDTLFEGFVIECKGVTIHPDRERRLLIQIRKKLGKPAIYRYEAGVSKQPGQYYFLNSSGNIIKNKSNLKLTIENLNKKYEDDLENEELNQSDEKTNKDNNSESELKDNNSESELKDNNSELKDNNFELKEKKD